MIRLSFFVAKPTFLHVRFYIFLTTKMVENAFFCKNELFVNTHFSMRAPIFTCARKIPCFFHSPAKRSTHSLYMQSVSVLRLSVLDVFRILY